MNNIKEQIICCEKCPLHKHMKISPVGPEFDGQYKDGVMCIIGTPLKPANDYKQEVISDIDRTALLKILKKELGHYYITPLIKCCATNVSRTYSKETTQLCKSWIAKEIAAVKPKLVLGFGANVKNVLSENDHPPWAKCDYYLPAVSNTINNKKRSQELITILRKFNNVYG